jgi:hypothetical protein
VLDSTFTVVIAHFGDVYWVRKAIEEASLDSLDEIEAIFIIDQNGADATLNKWTADLKKVEVIEFPSQGTGNANHANAINQFIKSIVINTSHLVLMDSDLIIQNHNWIDFIKQILSKTDGCLALDPTSDYLTHPCFMAIPKSALAQINFMEGMKNLRVDTGRTIGIQLDGLGYSLTLLKPSPAYGGAMGFTYLNSAFYHVTSISIRQQPSRRINKSKLRIDLAESWRRWVIFSKLQKNNSLINKLLFYTLRIAYSTLFILKSLISEIRLRKDV